MTDIIKALEYVLNVCPPIDQHGEMAQEEARAALATYRASVDAVELPEPFGYLWHSGRIRPDGGYEAGFEFSQDDCTPRLRGVIKQETVPVYDDSTVRRLIAEAVAREREECAKVSEAQIERWVDDRARYAASECAAAIRARGGE